METQTCLKCGRVSYLIQNGLCPGCGDLLPEGFGNDEISRQIKANMESFEEWWKRNRKMVKLRFISTPDEIHFLCVLSSAYYRKDLPEQITDSG